VSQCAIPILPAMVYEGANLLIIDLLDHSPRLRAERWQARRPAVILDLLRPLAAGNRAADGVEHDNPAQRKLAHGNPGRQKLADLLHGLQPHFVVDAGKSLAYVECFPVAVVVTMVVFGKARSARELACEQAAGQRHAGENPNFFVLGVWKKLFGWPLPEAIKNDLHGL